MSQACGIERRRFSLRATLLILIIARQFTLPGVAATPQEELQRALKLQGAGRLQEARQIYDRIIPQLRTSGDRKDLALALNALSVASISLGEYSKAAEAGQESAALRHALGNSAGEAASTNSIGLANMYLGNYSAALRYFQAALDLDLAGKDAESEILRRNNIGNVYFYQADYSAALGQYLLARSIVERAGNAEWVPRQRQLTTANMAVLYQKLGLYDRALDLYLGLRALPSALAAAENAQILMNQGVLYRRLGDPIKALQTYGAALSVFEREGNTDGKIGVLKSIGIAQAMDLEDLPAASVSFRQALDLARKSSNRREALQSRLYYAEMQRRLNRLDEAHALYAQTWQDAAQVGAAEEQWKALYGLGRIKQLQGDLDAALRDFTSAIQIIESVRSRAGSSSLRTGFLADKRDVYDAAIGLVLGSRDTGGAVQIQTAVTSPDAAAPGRIDLLFRLMESSRARTFQDRAAESLHAAAAREKPEPALRLKELRARMSVLWSQQLRAATGKSAGIEASLSELETQYTAMEEELRRSAAGAWQGILPSIAEVASRLDESTALVDLWIGESRLAMIWITSRECGVIPVEISPAVTQAVTDCILGLEKVSTQDWQKPCGRLSAEILPELLSTLAPGIRHLILVEDEKLAFLPLEALPIPSQPQMLIERFSVSYLPSVAFLAHRPLPSWSRMKMPWERSLLAFGDPQVGDAGPAGKDDIGFGRNLARLPYSEEEVRTVASELPGAKRIHLAKDALKRYLLDPDAARYPILHLSTHAAINAEDGQRSYIVFSPREPSAPIEYLFLGEIFGLNLHDVQLVTLSACETARGTVVRGEGVEDFSRAFLLTGAQATVAALWRVADQPTAEFMKQLYYFISEGRSKAEAVRATKLKFIRSGSELSHPYYWAAFVLSGDGASPVSVPMSWTRLLSVSLGLVALAVLAASWILLVRRRAGNARAPR